MLVLMPVVTAYDDNEQVLLFGSISMRFKYLEYAGYGIREMGFRIWVLGN